MFLAAMVVLSLVITYMKLPERLKTFLVKHQLITDIAVSLFIYFTLSNVSSSVTAITATVTATAVIGGLLFLGNK